MAFSFEKLLVHQKSVAFADAACSVTILSGARLAPARRAASAPEIGDTGRGECSRSAAWQARAQTPTAAPVGAGPARSRPQRNQGSDRCRRTEARDDRASRGPPAKGRAREYPAVQVERIDVGECARHRALRKRRGRLSAASHPGPAAAGAVTCSSYGSPKSSASEATIAKPPGAKRQASARGLIASCARPAVRARVTQRFRQVMPHWPNERDASAPRLSATLTPSPMGWLPSSVSHSRSPSAPLRQACTYTASRRPGSRRIFHTRIAHRCVVSRRTFQLVWPLYVPPVRFDLRRTARSGTASTSKSGVPRRMRAS